MIRLSCWVLSIGATGTAICLSVLAGWQRGGSLAERLVWVAIGVVLVVSAHLLPALLRESSAPVRGVALVLWLACMAAACFGHATFFLLAQRHAGELRALGIAAADLAPPVRSLAVVMAERADVIARLATVNARRCIGNCTTLENRRVTLIANLDALEAEAGEVQRRQAADDRAVTRRDALVVDPVTVRLAALLDTTVARVDLLSGLAFAGVLEGIACLLWTVTLRSRHPVSEASSVVAPLTVSHPPVTASRMQESVRRETEAVSHALVSEPVSTLATWPIGTIIVSCAYVLRAARAQKQGNTEIAWSYMADARYWCGAAIADKGIGEVIERTRTNTRSEVGSPGNRARKRAYNIYRLMAWRLARRKRPPLRGWQSLSHAAETIEGPFRQFIAAVIAANAKRAARNEPLPKKQAKKLVVIPKTENIVERLEAWLQEMPDRDKYFPLPKRGRPKKAEDPSGTESPCTGPN